MATKASSRYPSYTTGIVVLILIGFILLGLMGVLYFNRKWRAIMKSRIDKAIEKRRNFNDDFRSVNGYSWDYVMVFKIYKEMEHLTEEQVKFSVKKILTQLTDGGLELRLFYSYEHKEIYCKIRASLNRLKKEADRVNLNLLLDKDELKKYCEAGTKYWAGLSLPDDSPMTKMKSYEQIYAKYVYDPAINDTRADIAHLYQQHKSLVFPSITEEEARVVYERQMSVSSRIPINAKELEKDQGKDVRKSMQMNPMLQSSAISKKKQQGKDKDGEKEKSYGSPDIIRGNTLMMQSAENIEPVERWSIFRGVDRLKLIYSIVNCGSIGGCHLDTFSLLQNNCILAFFALHDEVELNVLESDWINFIQAPWNQDNDAIKDYFGEKVGLYFTFLSFYTSWLLPVAVLGLVAWINVVVEKNNPEAVTIPYYAGVMALWSSLMLEFWKRNEKTVASRWGMTDFEETEMERPQFFGYVKRSPITGSPYKYFPRFEQIKRSYKSYITIFVFIIAVISIIALIFLLRIVMNKDTRGTVGGESAGDVVSSLVIAVQIQVLNAFYGNLAFKLNEFENHRTDTEFEDALISKTFLFQFINSYISLIYIGFLKPFLQNVDPCLGPSCMSELQTTLGTIFITRLTVGNITELGLPLYWFATSLNERENVRKKKKNEEYDPKMQQDLSEVERAFVKPSYDTMMGTFDDFCELVIQFGYCTMFICSFPLATTMSFAANYVEIRIDSWKLCRVMRRPDPKSVEDIGSWYPILEIIAAAAVFTNSALIAFTGNFAINYTWTERSWIFLGISFGLFFIRLLAEYYVPDVPQDVELFLLRQEFIVSKVIDNLEDDNDDAITDFSQPSNYNVDQTDYDPL